jgi:hypothetical protein
MSAWVIETHGFTSKIYMGKDEGETAILSEAVRFNDLGTAIAVRTRVNDTYPDASVLWVN